MDTLLSLLMLLTGLAVGAAAVGIVLQSKLRLAGNLARAESAAEIVRLQTELQHRESVIDQQKQRELQLQQTEADQANTISQLRASGAKHEAEMNAARQRAAEQMAVLREAQQQLSDAFKALSSDALRHNNESFLKLAEATLRRFQESAQGDLEKRQQAIDALVRPVEKSLKAVDEKLQDIEKKRVEAYAGLQQQVAQMSAGQQQLKSETENLVRALRRPDVRGRWGEIQLQRVVEMAGMVEYCDFQTQQSVDSEQGQLRPDLVVNLPGGKNIVVDSKAPLAAFLESLDAPDDTAREHHLMTHARHVRTHIQSLSKKSYHAQFEHAPEFVVLFLPGEVFFSAALQQDPSLIEMGVEQNVIIATPTTLIALLRAVAYGWRQERLAENAREISELGSELYTRLSQMGKHLSKLGKSLESAVKSYNSTVGSMESRVLVSARRFDDLQVADAGKSLDVIEPVEQTPRTLQAPELQTGHPPTENASENET
jgi:DNA recombination protein RmuC